VPQLWLLEHLHQVWVLVQPRQVLLSVLTHKALVALEALLVEA
jgi:hypothetical protein